jgi:hypothetical protein
MVRSFLLFMTAAILSLQPGVSRPGFGGYQQAAAGSSDITGKWHFVFQTEGGDRENEADFKLRGDQVTGKWNSTDVKGTFKDGDLNLAFPYTSDEAGMTATLKLKGKLADGKLAGTWEYSEYTGMFTATRR